MGKLAQKASGICAAVLLVACGGEDAEEAGSGSYDVSVLDEKGQPIAGAIVVVDRPDGTRTETTTDADGVASFPPVDFSAGSIELTAFSPGRTLTSVLDVTAASGRVLHLSPMSSPPLTRSVKLSFANKLQASNCVVLSTTTGASGEDVCGDSHVLWVPADATGKILAIEHQLKLIKAAVAVDIPSSDGTLVIDFGKADPIEHASGTIAVPPTASSVSAAVYARSSRAVVSLGDDSPASGGQAAWELDFFRPLPESEVSTNFVVGAGSGMAGVAHEGYPGAQTLPAFPSGLSLPLASNPVSLFDPIEWDAGADRPDNLSIGVPISDQVFGGGWSIWFSPDRTSVTPRRPPDSIWNALDWKSAEEILVAVHFCDPAPGQCGGAPCAPGAPRSCPRWALGGAMYQLLPP